MTPYDSQPSKAFWRTAIADKDPLGIESLWVPKFPIIQTDTVATAGSCFAQHIGRALKTNGFDWFDAEPAPPRMRPSEAQALNYGIFSFRTGNIYTTALLRQWLNWANGKDAPDEWWEKDGRWTDPFRPVVEPGGFGSRAEAIVSRQGTIDAVRRAVKRSNIFVFTLGLTESWMRTGTDIHYPMCPGTAAGTFDAAQHSFVNLSYPEVRKALEDAIHIMRRINTRLKILLTVSPVPLTATATGQHVLAATTYSKSTLRAVAGDVAASYRFVDYFPSYEIVTGVPFRGMFFDPNLRTVAPDGVDFVMRQFFSGVGFKPADDTAQIEAAAGASDTLVQDMAASEDEDAEADDDGDTGHDVSCEEELLAAFGPST